MSHNLQQTNDNDHGSHGNQRLLVSKHLSNQSGATSLLKVLCE